MTVINFSNASFSACNYFMLLGYVYTISAHEMKLLGLLYVFYCYYFHLQPMSTLPFLCTITTFTILKIGKFSFQCIFYN